MLKICNLVSGCTVKVQYNYYKFDIDIIKTFQLDPPPLLVWSLVVTIHPGLLNTGLHSLLVLSPVLFKQLGSHGIGRRVRVGVT